MPIPLDCFAGRHPRLWREPVLAQASHNDANFGSPVIRFAGLCRGIDTGNNALHRGQRRWRDVRGKQRYLVSVHGPVVPFSMQH